MPYDPGMPRDLGPDMLRNLDERLAAGQIDLHTYEARKAEVLELIRKGKAREFLPLERVIFGVGSVLAFLFVVAMVSGMSSGGTFWGVLLLIGCVVLGFSLAGKTIRGN